jgi:hypothetical protein
MLIKSISTASKTIKVPLAVRTIKKKKIEFWKWSIRLGVILLVKKRKKTHLYTAQDRVQIVFVLDANMITRRTLSSYQLCTKKFFRIRLDVAFRWFSAGLLGLVVRIYYFRVARSANGIIIYPRGTCSNIVNTIAYNTNCISLSFTNYINMYALCMYAKLQTNVFGRGQRRMRHDIKTYIVPLCVHVNTPVMP